MKSILVTGGAGFIGSNFINYMLDTHDSIEVICIDVLSYAADLSNLKKANVSNRFKFFQGNICDRGFVESVLNQYKIDVLVNFAAESHVDRSITNPYLFLQSNYVGVGVLLELSVKYGVKKFHQVSTDEVYGDLPLHDLDASFVENDHLEPSSPYSASKAAADLLVLAFNRTYSLDVTISRSSNNFGPNQFPEKLIPMIIKNAMDNKKIPLYGDGENIRDWIHVMDHCSAIDVIIHKGKSGEIYNVSANNEVSNLDLTKQILVHLNKPFNLIEFVADRPGHDLRYSVNSSKLRELGWKEIYSLEDYLGNLV